MFTFQAAMMAVFFFTTSNPILFYVVAALIDFNFGGNLALFPACCADSFGAEKLAVNYGFVFTAYGIGGIVGPTLAGLVQNAGLSFLYAFLPAAALCSVAAVLGFVFQIA